MNVILEIKGGFGNQVFQFAFAKYLSDLGYKVKVNYQNKSEFNLNHEFFNFKLASKFKVKIFRFIYKTYESKKFNIVFKLIFKKIFQKFSKLEQFTPTSLKLYNHFDGYWQDVEILDKYKSYILNSLEKYETFSYKLDESIKIDRTLLHIRRGDYLNINENLDINFYEKSIEYCKNKVSNFQFDIFTDDIDWVRNQKIFKDAKNIYGPSNNLKDLLIDVSRMMKYKNYIIGNSSFSLVSAVISCEKDSLVIVAAPWFRNSNRDLNFKKDWIQFPNK